MFFKTFFTKISKSLILCASVILILPSCGNDDEPSGTLSNLSSDEIMLLGGWSIKGLAPMYDGYTIVFMEDESMYFAGDYYNWQYDVATRFLSTNFRYSWDITGISEKAWSGRYLDSKNHDNNGNVSYAERNTEGGLRFILNRDNWIDKEGHQFPIRFYTVGGYSYTDFNDYSANLYFEENVDKTKATLKIQTREGTFNYTIYNPYNRNKVYIKGENKTYYPKN